MTVPQAFERGLQLHQTGRLAEAEALYRQILAAQPDHTGALHLLGVICHQAGRDDLAIDLIGRSIALHPNNPSAHSNLGEVYRTLGRFDEAISSYRQTLLLQPDHPEAFYNLGNAFMAKGQATEAVASYRRALEIRPNYAEANINLGTALVNLEQFDEAIATYRRALLLKPDAPETYNNLCAVLIQQERFDEALVAVGHALELKPDHAEAYNNLAITLATTRHFDEAIAAFQRALEFQPHYPQACSNLGNALREIGRTDEAVAACRRALELDPNYAEAQNNLGSALLEKGCLDEAEASFDRALELQAGFDEARVNQAMLRLLRGDFERGWAWYESRLRVHTSVERNLTQPRWDGGALEGRRVLVQAEQGFGDAIHFVRYAALLAGRGGEVIVECRSPLAALFRTAAGVREVAATGDPPPPFDVQVQMLSLPLLFQTRGETIPREIPYLFADPDRRDIWTKRLGHEPARPKIGLCWEGNPANRRNRTRNISLANLLPILHVEDIDFYSLQVAADGNESPPPSESALLIDHTAQIHDFADTAALLAEIDLVISVDTAVAHLAGALGRPVWTLLPFVPDWRWGLEGEDTPWYPTMRLFRQTAAGDWDSVVQRVTGALHEWLARTRQ